MVDLSPQQRDGPAGVGSKGSHAGVGAGWHAPQRRLTPPCQIPLTCIVVLLLERRPEWRRSRTERTHMSKVSRVAAPLYAAEEQRIVNGRFR